MFFIMFLSDIKHVFKCFFFKILTSMFFTTIPRRNGQAELALVAGYIPR